MSNKKTKRAREVFLDFTMNDDNDLLEQIHQVDKSFALHIPSDANKVKHTKVTMAKNENKGKTVNMKKSNLSVDLAGSNEFQTPTLNDLVKETEELIETISETVQETSKISTQKIDLDLEAVAASMFTSKEDLPETMAVNEKNKTVFTSPFDALDAFPTIDQDLREADPYTPHFINEDLLQDTIAKAETGGQNSPFLADTLSAADLFDDMFEDESDLLDQTGSFLFNTKDLHLFSQEDTVDEENEVIRQAKVEQTIPETKIAQISELSQKLSELERTGEPEKVETVEAENVEPDITSTSFSTGELAKPDLPALEEKKPKMKTESLVEEPTVVAKVEDIDLLMQKLDELSEKEVLSSLSANSQANPQIDKEQISTINSKSDSHDPATNLTSEEPAFTAGNDVSKDKPLVSLTDSIIEPGMSEAQIKPKAPRKLRKTQQSQVIPQAAEDTHHVLHTARPSQAEHAEPQGAHILTENVNESVTGSQKTEKQAQNTAVYGSKATKQATFQPDQSIPLASEQHVASNAKEHDFTVNTDSVGSEMPTNKEASTNMFEKAAGEKQQGLEDLTPTQPINLAEIERINAQLEATQKKAFEENVQAATEHKAQSAKQHTEATSVLDQEKINEAMDSPRGTTKHSSVSSLDVASPVTNESTFEAILTQQISALAANTTQQKTATSHGTTDPYIRTHEADAASIVDTSVPIPKTAARQAESLEQMMSRQGIAKADGTTEQLANFAPLQDEQIMQTTAQASSSETGQESSDIASFASSFEQVFAQATMQPLKTMTEQMMETNELMNLHEEMKRVEAEKAQALASEEPPIDLEVGNQETNPLDFPDVYFVNGGGSVSSSAYHATSAVNYAAYLDASTQENEQLSALVNNEIRFSELEQQEPREIKTAPAPSVSKASARSLQASTKGMRAFKHEKSAHMRERQKTQPIAQASLEVGSDIGSEQTEKKQAQTFADTGTTLVDFAALKTDHTSTKPLRNSKTRTKMPDDDFLKEESTFEIKQEPQKAIVAKPSNHGLVITIIILMLIILALLSFIIFSVLM